METRQVPSFNYRADLHYHTSAVLALGLDTLTLPWRSLNGPYASPGEVVDGLNSYGRKIANLDIVLPFQKPTSEKLNHFLNTYSLDDVISVTPHTTTTMPKSIDYFTRNSIWCQSVSSRGIFGSEAPNMDFLGYFDRVMNKTTTAVTTSRCELVCVRSQDVA